MIDQFSTWINPENKTAAGPRFQGLRSGRMWVGHDVRFDFSFETAKFGQHKSRLVQYPVPVAHNGWPKHSAKPKPWVINRSFPFQLKMHWSMASWQKLLPVEFYLEETNLAKKWLPLSPVALQLAKEAVNRSFETHLDEGIENLRAQKLLSRLPQKTRRRMALWRKRRLEFRGDRFCQQGNHLIYGVMR